MLDMEELIDKKFTKVWVESNEDDERQAVIFEGADGCFELSHDQDCCEHVYIEDIVVTSQHEGLQCLENTPILSAECVTSSDVTPEGLEHPDYDSSYTWTFFKIATLKGYVDIRFFGSSNGYYSEDASLKVRE